MSKADSWLGGTDPRSAWVSFDRTVDTARWIADKPISIVIIRAGEEQAAQTVRIDSLSTRPRGFDRDGSETAKQTALVTGYKNHATITDTDIQRGDEFAYEDQFFEVIDVIPATPYNVQAVVMVRA